MKARINLLTLLAFLASGHAIAEQSSEHKSHWGYNGVNGPEHWGTLSSKYITCSAGANQSPVNLTNPIDADLTPLTMSYQAGSIQVANNGHTIQVNYHPGSTLSIDEHKFELKQFHFHSPSEHKIQGKSFPMEAHLVHADNKGHLAVVAVMFTEGAENKTLKQIWAKMPKNSDITNSLNPAISVDGILPADRGYFRFNGSLTTPPCSEGVLWLVMKSPITASKEQIGQFTSTINHPNNRPIQPLNARAVIK